MSTVINKLIKLYFKNVKKCDRNYGADEQESRFLGIEVFVDSMARTERGWEQNA